MQSMLFVKASGKPGQAWHQDEDYIPTRDRSLLGAWIALDDAKAGSIVFFNGYLLHRSLPNRAATGFRRALVNHYMSASSLLPWMLAKDVKGSVGVADYRDIVMVAGSDPYAWKGTVEIAKANVRPSGEGGCESWGGNPAKSPQS
jgi:hypothetical protein